MSELIFESTDEDGYEEGFINNVYFYYTSLKKAYLDKESGKNKFEAKIVLDEETANKYLELMKDTFKQKQNKVYDVANEDFEKQFKTAPPFPEQSHQFYIRMSVVDEGKEGKPLAYDEFKRPKVYVPTDEEGVIEDITMKKNIGNGSMGDLRFYMTPYKGKKFPKLKEIFVRDLIEYAGGGSGGSAFGTVKGGQEESPSSFGSVTKEGREAAPEASENPEF